MQATFHLKLCLFERQQHRHDMEGKFEVAVRCKQCASDFSEFRIFSLTSARVQFPVGGTPLMVRVRRQNMLIPRS